MGLKPVTVTQLNDYVARVISTDPILGNIYVQGEISNIKYHSSGHIYFSISDENSKVSCFLPASYAENLDMILDDGIEVIINGFINVYKKGGYYTLFVKHIEPLGAGSLAIAFQKMKEKLALEGLFDSEHKLPIPKFPKRIAIITSETGAAVQDIIKIIKSRTNLTDIIIFPCKVQGDGAGEDIANKVRLVSDKFYGIVDTIILGRGGGSAEDLAAFNDESLARAIYDCRIPMISAVGHEIDFSISDFVADMRAETPTAAAEIAVPNTNELVSDLVTYKNILTSGLDSKMKYEALMMNNRMLDLKSSLKLRIEYYRHAIEKEYLILQESNPQNILSKGYNILSDRNGNVVTSAALVTNDEYSMTFADGNIKVKVERIEEKQ